MTGERELALRIANQILEDHTADPDGDTSVLARQYIRAIETIDKARKIVHEIKHADV